MMHDDDHTPGPEGDASGPDVDIQLADGLSCPPSGRMRDWLQAALAHAGAAHEAELSVRVVDEAEMSALNGRYRHKDGPTNVLSFPFEALPGVDVPLLGDIVLCAPVLQREAAAQGKQEAAHWAHLLVHGALHLLGFDHQQAEEAEAMEAAERRILAGLGFADPYAPVVQRAGGVTAGAGAS